MKSFLIVLVSIACIADTRLTSRDNATVTSPASSASNGTRYAILDNDWGSTGFIPYLLALGAGMEVLGLASDTANTWVDQTTLHGVSPQHSRYETPKISHHPEDKYSYTQLACDSGERKSVLHPRNSRRDIPSDTDLPAFSNMAATLGEPVVARSICTRKSDGPVSGQ